MTFSLALASALLLGLATVGQAQDAAPAARRGAAPGQPERGTFRHGAERLEYRLYRPGSLPAGARPPLVLLLHGCTQDAADFAAGTRFDALAEQLGFLAVYPEQPPSSHPQRCWNWYDPAHQARGAGEPALLAGLARALVEEHAADARRVYVTGISAGGAMAQVLAAAYPDVFAAAASHSGIRPGAARDLNSALAAMQGRAAPDAEPTALPGAVGERRRVVPLLLLHGDADAVVSPASLEQSLGAWRAAAAAAAGQPLACSEGEYRQAGSVYPVTRIVCRTGERSVLESWLVQGLGHAWSGGSPEGTYTDPAGPDASRAVAEFLLGHRLPESGS